jgi:hypothetical protein
MRLQHFLCKCERRILSCKNCINLSGTIGNYAKYCTLVTIGLDRMSQESEVSNPSLCAAALIDQAPTTRTIAADQW